MATILQVKNGGAVYLYLGWSKKGKGVRQSLGLRLFANPKGREEMRHNAEVMREANSVLAAKEMELNGFKNGLVKNTPQSVDIIKGFADWGDECQNQDQRSAVQAAKWFARYCDFKRVATLDSSTAHVSFFDNYGQWLNSQTTTYKRRPTPMALGTRIKLFRKLRTYLNMLFKDDLLPWPPQRITAKWKPDKSTVKKPTPTGAELRKLMDTPKPHDEVCNAWLFCANTGLDYSTVSQLTWGALTKDGCIEFQRTKTGRSNKVPLNKTALQCLPERGANNALIFDLPSHVSCMKWVRKWAYAAALPNAGKYTWHSARHTLGMILGNEKQVPLEELRSLYGHSTVAMTGKYYQASTKAVTAAVRRMDEL